MLWRETPYFLPSSQLLNETRYITANAEKLRDVFVSHQGNMELQAHGGGNILSADYADLIGQLSAKIDKNTKGTLEIVRRQLFKN